MKLVRNILLLGVGLVWGVRAMAQTDTVAMQLNVEDVVVTAAQHLFSNTSQGGNINLSTEKLHTLPRFGGSVDLLKLLQFTPGTSPTAEGNTGLFVRGGDSGQNLLLLNGAPLYAPSHLFGFFSTLNSAHIGGLTLLKSNIPSQYGSALSSVTDVRTHQHIPSRNTFEGNIGIIESDLATQLRVGERVGIFASARHSYASWLSKLITKENSLRYEFGDYGLGLTADLGKVGYLTLNTHFNNDRMRLSIPTYDSHGNMSWWNSSSSAILHSRIGDRTTMENTLYATLFDTSLDIFLANNRLLAYSKIGDYGLRNTTTTTWEQVTLTAGGEYAFRNILPQQLVSVLSAERHTPATTPTHEAALYGSVNWRAHKYLTLDAGLRLSMFASDGVWATPEPRIMATIPIGKSCSVWGSYNLLSQYIQNVTQSNTGFATDFYVGATRANPPQRAHNLSLGYKQSVLDGALSWSVEGFYRRMFNVVEYQTNISAIMAGNYAHSEYLYSGEGEAYGIETGIGYSSRKLNMQLNYTLARSLRQFEQLNYGRAFAARNDRRHNLSMIALYEPIPQLSLSATFTYASGAPYTTAIAVYIVGGSFLKEYGPYNGARLPDMHHLDVSATWWFRCSKGRRSGINLSIYNIYARRNPKMISWIVSKDKQDPTIIRIKENHHILYTIVPSVSWTFKF